ncbi:energy transducer TonB [Burkholderia pseudomultivorans]|uniref:energy transducer TonB n=2 Tax=Burkholderia pseudomultivorans TaxID=1207504 RepID=UPI001E548A9B|nr:energy transducer TonB [Burkholderia pseudomultivorans]
MRRFAMAIGVASLLWYAFLGGVLKLFMGERPAPARPEAIQMQLVELPPVELPPPSPGMQHVDHAEPVAVQHHAVSRPTTAQAPHAPTRPTPPIARPATAPSNDAPVTPSPSTPTQSAYTADDARRAPPTQSDAPPAHANSTGGTQARLLSQPLPALPDDLREQAYQAVAVARFFVHANGTFDIELVKPTPNPRLNQILLETLRKWRFFPATEDGHPVESRQDVRVHFNVE